MAVLIDTDALPHSPTAYRFEGHDHGPVDVSFFLVEAQPGRGPSLHTHPYAEVFVILQGEVCFTVGEETITATAGQLVIVPPEIPHAYVNAGTGSVRHLDIHGSGRMITDWLEA